MKTEWFWCLHCERVFEGEVPDDHEQGKLARGIGQMCLDEDGDESWRCPHGGCDGGLLDFWHWSKVREENPDYPEEPRAGEVYPLYPKGETSSTA